MGFDGSHANFHFVEEVMPTCLKQYRQRHDCRAHERDCGTSLCNFVQILLFGAERSVHGHLGIILVELGEESSFQVKSGIDGVRGRLLNQSKATLLRVLMKSLAKIVSLPTTLPVCDRK